MCLLLKLYLSNLQLSLIFNVLFFLLHNTEILYLIWFVDLSFFLQYLRKVFWRVEIILRVSPPGEAERGLSMLNRERPTEIKTLMTIYFHHIFAAKNNINFAFPVMTRRLRFWKCCWFSKFGEIQDCGLVPLHNFDKWWIVF